MFKLTQEELNCLSNLLTNTSIICLRAINDGYMNEEEIAETLHRRELYMSILAKVVANNIG